MNMNCEVCGKLTFMDPVLFRPLPHDCVPMPEKEPEMATEWKESDDVHWLVIEMLDELDSCDDAVIEVERRLLEKAITYLTAYEAIMPVIEELADEAEKQESV